VNINFDFGSHCSFWRPTPPPPVSPSRRSAAPAGASDTAPHSAPSPPTSSGIRRPRPDPGSGRPLLRRNRLQLVDLRELGGRGEIARLQRATDGLELSNILDGKAWSPDVIVLHQRAVDLGHILRLVDIFLGRCRPHD